MYFDLSSRQIKILEFIIKDLDFKGYPPSIREICDAVNLKSSSTVHSHLNFLEKKGYISRNPASPRAISVLKSNKVISNEPNNKIFSLPLVDRFTKGKDILSHENISKYIDVPEFFVSSCYNFLYLFNGSGLEKFGIYNKDHVIVKKSTVAFDGDLVLAILYGEFLSVRKYFMKDGMVVLRGDCDIILDSSLVEVVGIVDGVIRTQMNTL